MLNMLICLRLLERVDRIMDRLETPTFIRSETQDAVAGVFNEICADYPGSIAVRHSHARLQELTQMDREEERRAPDGCDIGRTEATQSDIVIPRIDYFQGTPTMKGDIDMDGITNTGGMESTEQRNDNDVHMAGHQYPPPEYVYASDSGWPSSHEYVHVYFQLHPAQTAHTVRL
jgi:hypothetical protein